MKLNGYFVFAAAMGGMVCAVSAKPAGELADLFLINSQTEHYTWPGKSVRFPGNEGGG